MNPQDPLAALNPLREPTMISWWPLAPGWWIVIVVATLILAAVTILLLRRHFARAYRREAARQAQQLYTQWQTGGDSAAYITAINTLLKGVALKAYPRQDVAGTSGTAWISFLNQAFSDRHQQHAFSTEFSLAMYQQGAPDVDCDALLQSSLQWLAQHRTVQ